MKEAFWFPGGITFCIVYFISCHFPIFHYIQAVKTYHKTTYYKGSWQILTMFFRNLFGFLCLINVDSSPGFMCSQSTLTLKLAKTWWLNLASKSSLSVKQLSVPNSHLQYIFYVLDQLLQNTKDKRSQIKLLPTVFHFENVFYCNVFSDTLFSKSIPADHSFT